MNPISKRTWIATAWLFCSFAACAETPATSEPARRALLIGINDYQEDKVSDLNGAVNDVEILSHVLKTRFGFPATGISTLTDKQATRDNILSALRDFVAATGPGDVVYIHFSGHGSQAPDKNGDEPDDRMDETIVPHDGRAEGIPDITDDELSTIFADLKTDNALIVLDSCHSGTGTRSVRLQARSIPADEREALYRSAGFRGEPETADVSGFDYVLMTGAAADQNALDGPIDNKFYGVFSYALASSLDAGPDASPATVMAGVGEEFLRIEQLWGGTRLPNPQLEGKPERLSAALYPSLLETSAGSAPADKSFLEAAPGDRGEVVLTDGARLGAIVGSIWGIYAAQTTDFSRGALAAARVTRAQGDDAVALLDRRVDVPAHARAVKVIPGSLTGPISIDLRASTAVREPLIREVQDLLEGVDFVPRNSFAQFVVDIVANQVTVYGAAGLDAHDRFDWTDPASAASRLAATFTKSHAGAKITDLSNHSSQIELSVDVVAADAVRGVGVVSSVRKARYKMRQPGEARSHGNSLMLEVQSSHEAYITIASVDAEGSVSVLFPNTYQDKTFMPEGRIPANRSVRIPDSHNENNSAGFHWDIVPPAGQDVVQVFAATDLETALQIRRYIAELAEETKARRTRGTAYPDSVTSAADTQQLRDRLGTRGIGLVESGADTVDTPIAAETNTDWTVSAARIEVGD
ncbi:MAG: caspase family protein [Gammaproteobacteria bacterium]|nr:caspase family protein [Gammaproteobacteria bacterium]